MFYYIYYCFKSYIDFAFTDGKVFKISLLDKGVVVSKLVLCEILNVCYLSYLQLFYWAVSSSEFKLKMKIIVVMSHLLGLHMLIWLLFDGNKFLIQERFIKTYVRIITSNITIYYGIIITLSVKYVFRVEQHQTDNMLGI